MTDDPPYLVRLGQLQQDAAALLYHCLPESGWSRAVIEYRMAGRVGESVLTCTYTDGRKESLQVPMALVRAMKDIRNDMAAQGKGAWLSAELVVDSGGHVSIDFNYNERPIWRMPPTDEAYMEDMQMHPRPDSEIPSWYPRGKG